MKVKDKINLTKPYPPDLSIYECKKCDMMFSEYCVVVEKIVAKANKPSIKTARCPICNEIIKPKVGFTPPTKPADPGRARFDG